MSDKVTKKQKADLTESIKVSPQVKSMIDEIKLTDGHTSVDSVLRYLLDIRAIVVHIFPNGIWRMNKEDEKNGSAARESN